MYKFCNYNIKEINFCIVNGDTMNSIHASLVERFQAVKTVPGTYLEPITSMSQSMKML